MDTRFSIWSGKMAAVFFMAFMASVLCAPGASAAENAKVGGMRAEALRELAQLKKTPDRLRERASQLAANVAKERERASSAQAGEFRTLEDEPREVARTGDLSKMGRKAGAGPNAAGGKLPPDDREAGKKTPDKDKRPPDDPRKDGGEPLPPKDGDAKRKPGEEHRPPEGDRGKEERPPLPEGGKRDQQKNREPARGLSSRLRPGSGADSDAPARFPDYDPARKRILTSSGLPK